MLLVALMCELNKDSWWELLVEDGHTPIHKLEWAVQQVQDQELRSFLDALLQRARPPVVSSSAQLDLSD
jgi:hypothetical protein